MPDSEASPSTSTGRGRATRVAAALTRHALCVALGLAVLLHGESARAGPPFLTDDPEPVEPGH